MRRLATFSSACLAAALTLAASARVAHATANYVYHEQTTNLTGGSCGNYLTTPTPGPTDTYPLAWKIEYATYTDNTVVYYTTDGSMPSGAMGVATAGTTTQVLAGTYGCTFGTVACTVSQTVDVANATIPAQPAGTMVHYIISAWHSGGGSEVFANSGTCNSGCGTCTAYTTSSCATVFTYTVSTPIDMGTPDTLPSLDVKVPGIDMTLPSLDVGAPAREAALMLDMKVTPDMKPAADMKVTPDMKPAADMKVTPDMVTPDMAARADTAHAPDAGVPDMAGIDAPATDVGTTDAAPAEAPTGSEGGVTPDVGTSMMSPGSQGCSCSLGGHAPVAPMTGGALLLLAFLALPWAVVRLRKR